jgi:uncharacterized protein YbjT (DUF2867 family)
MISSTGLHALARMAPALPLIGGGRTRFQPFYAGDVAQAAARALNDAGTQGKLFELGGPEVMTLKEIMQLVLKEDASQTAAGAGAVSGSRASRGRCWDCCRSRC